MIHTGDCIAVMRGMEADSVDAVVTDPPYGLEFMGKDWDKFKTRKSKEVTPFDPQRKAAMDRAPETEKGNPWASERPSYGAPRRMPKCRKCGKWQYNGWKPRECSCEEPEWVLDTWTYPSKFQAWCEAWGREALRVTKPGGYLLAFGGTRTHHRLVCGLEDAGWIIRDELTWVYASGFPKGKANLKPAHEPIVLARKPGPLRPLNIEETRIGTADGHGGGSNGTSGFANGYEKGDGFAASSVGRWPSNLLLSDPELFDSANPYVVGSGATATSGSRTGEYGGSGAWSGPFGPVGRDIEGDTGGYSRFFIVPKAGRSDREPMVRGTLEPGMVGGRSRADGRQWDIPGSTLDNNKPKRENTHPTCKPTDLMAHLIRLVCPPDGVILDPFLGSGSTAVAAEREGVKWIGIEKEPEYVAIAEARLNGTQRGLGLDVGAPTSSYRPPAKMPPPRFRESGVPKGWTGGWADSPDEEPAA